MGNGCLEKDLVGEQGQFGVIKIDIRNVRSLLGGAFEREKGRKAV
jgi:hypothetical protein